mmetsp:Transcript_54378/g.129589  ORF Transcript_54378/g.129589 Transcript_54378/m.129589 type:complete len:506 (+) Transcript_54378:53-1570(+)
MRGRLATLLVPFAAVAAFVHVQSSGFVGGALSSIQLSRSARVRTPALRSRARLTASGPGEIFPELPPLPSDEIIDAVARAGPRVTVADAAAAGGMSLEEARKGLVDLAAALGTKANIEVTKGGELIYIFPEDPRQALSEVSALATAREAWTSAKPLVFTLLRTAFGVALFVSIALIFSAIFVFATAGSSDREDRDDRRSDSFGGGGGGFGFGFGPNLYFGPSPFDLWFYQPYGYYPYQEEPKKMGFLESVYSFVFGDGDPNEGREQRALAAVAAAARRNGGVLTGEQLAPLLDPPSYRSYKDTINVNESWALDAVARLNGRPEVTKSGEIVYVFEDLQSSVSSGRDSERPPALLPEREVPFSLADEGNLTLVGLLGVLNLVGAAYLGAQLAALPAGIILPAWLAFTKTIYPGLLAYAVGFFAGPAFRWFNLQQQNAEIEERNSNREEWLEVLRSGKVDGKLAEARQMRKLIKAPASNEVLYSTSKEASLQRSTSDLDDFDRRLGR